MRIVTAAEMRAIDLATSEEAGIESIALMENAGAAVADHILEEFPHTTKICIFCGKGNNGGDGFVVARHLENAGKEVKVYLLARPEEVKGDAAEVLSRMNASPVAIYDQKELPKLDGFELIVDALLGTGLRPPVEGLYSDAIAEINRSGLPVVSVDIPSGADADLSKPGTGPIVHASSIVTFTALKPAHAFQFQNTPTVVRDIGSPPAVVEKHAVANLHLINPEDFKKLLAPRLADANKGSFGHVLVLGGSPGKAGAPAMAGMAALRAGAGLVTVASPKGVQSLIASFSPELMTAAIEENENGSFSILALEVLRGSGVVKDKTVLAIGPGISTDKEAAQFVRSAIDKTVLPVVLDADGLNAFEGRVQELNMRDLNRTLVLTPHPGEMARLCGVSTEKIQADRIGVTRKFAQEHHCYVVLKGNRSVVAEPDGKVWINPTGNPGMATGGTGDILTGMIAGLLAQHKSNVAQAVIGAVYLHGLAGDLARDEVGEISLTATDLLMTLPHAIRQTQGMLEA
ncbi:MAG TPA: NAD(P)H-hydrate dehydratase [Terriglobales bacterium]|nr:NAD(P)H-hydrate dehydratase [Terriglobales bacterium]